MTGKTTSQVRLPDSIPRQSKTGLSHRILVVDDEPQIRRLITVVLLDSGYRVDAAEDGSAAWELLQNSSYDLLITDNNMPNVSGVELLKKLHAAQKDLPVIMLSGTMSTEELKKLSGLIPEAVLPKPFALAELLNTVKRVLDGSEFVAGGSELFGDCATTDDDIPAADKPTRTPI